MSVFTLSGQGKEYDGMTLPPYFPLKNNPKQRLEEIKSLHTRDDDILLAIYPRSGGHWLYEIVMMLLQGHSEYVVQHKVSTMLEAIPDIKKITENAPSPRVLNTHLPIRWLPRRHTENGGKIIHCVRNPKDIATSMYFHEKCVTGLEHRSDVTLEKIFDLLFLKEPLFYGGWFQYEKEFEEATKDEKLNIHTVHFENLKKHPQAEIKRLADFLQVDYCNLLIEEIADRCSFEKLKEANDTVKDKTISCQIMMEADPKRDIDQLHTSSFFRKGIVGDWKNHFTVCQNQQFDEMYKQMAGSELHLQFE